MAAVLSLTIPDAVLTRLEQQVCKERGWNPGGGQTCSQFAATRLKDWLLSDTHVFDELEKHTER